MKKGNFFRLGLALVLTLVFTASAFAEEIKAIHIVTPEWETITNKDGTGFFFDLVRNVYEPAGIKMEYKIVPWKRAERMVSLKKADAMLCVALQNITKDMLAPKNPMVVDYAGVVFKKDKIKEWKGVETLNGKSAVWLRGYDMHKNPNMKGVNLKKWYEIDGYAQAWDMLKRDRMDVYIEPLVDLQRYIKEQKIDMSPYRMETLWGEKMFVAFSNSERSKKLIKVYDKRIIELFKSGELKKIFEKGGIYPFPPDAWKE